MKKILWKLLGKSGKSAELDALEGIFVMFNYPETPLGCGKFTGHSLSVSDIVYYKGKYWYCDIRGWKEIG